MEVQSPKRPPRRWRRVQFRQGSRCAPRPSDVVLTKSMSNAANNQAVSWTIGSKPNARWKVWRSRTRARRRVRGIRPKEDCNTEKSGHLKRKVQKSCQILKEHSSERTTRESRCNHRWKQRNRAGNGQTVRRGRRVCVYHRTTPGAVGQSGRRYQQECDRHSERCVEPR